MRSPGDRMKNILMTSVVVLLAAIGMRASFDSAQDRQQAPPPWVYTVNPPPTPGATAAFLISTPGRMRAKHVIQYPCVWR